MTPDKPQKRRQCGPKVKTGCQTCKIRRVKCDEGKPFCLRCSSTGRKCDGYEDRNALQTIPRVSIHIPGSSDEKRGFQYFLKNTSVELSGYYDKSFWEHLLLQASSSEPALRHAVIAIGSLHEDFSNKRLTYSSENSGFAIKQYTKAISHLRRSLSAGLQAPLTALMSCVLFVCFDSLRGHFTGAMVHLQSGLKILRDLRERGKINEKIIEDTIAPIFMRLSLQSILYIDTRGNGDRQAFATDLMQCRSYQEVPDHFESLEEARRSMNQSVDGLFRMLYMCDGDLPCCYQPIEAFELHDIYSRQLQQWKVVFEKFMNENSHLFNSKEIRGAALLKIHSDIVNIMANTTKPDMEDTRTIAAAVNSPGRFVPFNKDFQNVVNLSRSLIAAAELDAKNGKSSLTFSTDLGIIAPLYYTATHCSDILIREEALALLSRCPRREGMWDGEATSVMIRQFWQIEATHKALQQAADGKEEVAPLSEMIDLEMHDGMIWEWKLKDPTTIAKKSRTTTPEYSWIDRFIKSGSEEHLSTPFGTSDVSDVDGTMTDRE